MPATRRRAVVARARSARPDRSRAHDGAVPVLARQRLDLARLRRRPAPAALGARPRRSDRRVARRHRLHRRRSTYRRREPRRPGRRSRSPCAIPSACARLVTISAGLRPDGWGTATRHLQRELVRDGLRTGDVATGMARARQLGMLTYRGRDELDTRFGVLAPELAQPPVAAYLDHHGQRFAAAVPGAHVPAAQRGDRSLPVRRRSARRCAPRSRASPPTCSSSACPATCCSRTRCSTSCIASCRRSARAASLWKLDSEYGHDAFLADQDKLAALLRDAGAFARRARPRARASTASARGPCARSGSA